MEHACIQTIREEHSSIASVLSAILAMIKRGPRDDADGFFDALRAMLFYLDEFPARLHHPKESAYLFKPLLDKEGEAADLVAKLEIDHGREEAAIRELQHLLTAWEYLGTDRRMAFEHAAERYVRFYLEHMRLEETVVIPQARKLLNAEEWTLLDAQFAANVDPLASNRPRDPSFDKLFTRIVMTAPAPIGLG